MPSGTGAVMDNGYNYGINSNTPFYPRVSSIPAWLPPAGLGELEQQYRDTNKSYDTSEYDAASRRQQGRVLTTALNGGTAAAAEYANKARQAGGSGLGAGLVKAQAQVGAQSTAGSMEMDRVKFDAQQREDAATHATQIASTLGELRGRYLNSIVDYATREDQINSNESIEASRRKSAGGGGGSGINPFGAFPAIIGRGIMDPYTTINYNSYEDYINKMKPLVPSLFGG
jgi:hypothetical protein